MAWTASSSRWARWRRWGGARWSCCATPRRHCRHARGRDRAGRRVLGRPDRADVRGALRGSGPLSRRAGSADLVAGRHPGPGRGRHRVHPGLLDRAPDPRGRMARAHQRDVEDVRGGHPARRHPRGRLDVPGASSSRWRAASARDRGQPAVHPQPAVALPAGRGRRPCGARLHQGAPVSGRTVVAVGADRRRDRSSCWSSGSRRRRRIADVQRRCRLRRRSASGWPRSWRCIPGVSRSRRHDHGRRTRSGCSRQAAAEFSFFLAVPVMFAATRLDLSRAGTC